MKGEYLREKLKSQDLTLAEIARKIKLSPQSLENRLKAKDVKIDFIIELSKAINKSVYFFIKGSDVEKYFYKESEKENTAGNTAGNVSPKMSPNVSPNNKKVAPNIAPNDAPNDEKIIKYPTRTDKYLQEQSIPLFDMEAAAGMLPMLTDLNSQEPVDYLYIPNAPACDGAIFATGDSMYPLLKSGDILAFKIIHDIQNNVFWGEMYILYIDVEGDNFRVVKYVQKGKDDLHYRLVSQNKNHQDKEVRIDKIRAMAQVKLSIRMN